MAAHDLLDGGHTRSKEHRADEDREGRRVGREDSNSMTAQLEDGQQDHGDGHPSSDVATEMTSHDSRYVL